VSVGREELGDTETLHQLEQLRRIAPVKLRFALLTRSHLRLGLHRLRLEGEITEICPMDLRFAMAFSGRDRRVAQYLFAEILEHQPGEVPRLPRLTSVLDRFCGSLADRLLGSSGSERILSELEQAGAFVAALDPERRWFRYHRLLADLLGLELRRTASERLRGVHLAPLSGLQSTAIRSRRSVMLKPPRTGGRYRPATGARRRSPPRTRPRSRCWS
jgi:LuxR family maltose regulon positive regulatory protein